MTTFQVNRNIIIVCEFQKTRSGFKHLATLRIKGVYCGSAECRYLNRTWERYAYQSVLQKLARDNQTLSKSQRKAVQKYIKDYDRVKDDLKPLKVIAGIAKLGEVFGATIKEKNDWKARMLKAGLAGKGLIMPENWHELSEAEKEERLNGAIKQLA